MFRRGILVVDGFWSALAIACGVGLLVILGVAYVIAEGIVWLMQGIR